jgi:hypothetical protein
MIAPRALAALALLAFLGIASLAQAAGPLDGVYTLNATAPDSDPFQMYLVVIQNGTVVGIAILDPLFGEYFYGFATLSAEQGLQGVLFYGDGLEAGSFNLRFQGTNVVGDATLFEFPFTFVGPKVF